MALLSRLLDLADEPAHVCTRCAIPLSRRTELSVPSRSSPSALPARDAVCVLDFNSRKTELLDNYGTFFFDTARKFLSFYGAPDYETKV